MFAGDIRNIISRIIGIKSDDYVGRIAVYRDEFPDQNGSSAYIVAEVVRVTILWFISWNVNREIVKVSTQPVNSELLIRQLPEQKQRTPDKQFIQALVDSINSWGAEHNLRVNLSAENF